MLKDLLEGASFVLAKVENLPAFVVISNMASEVGPLVDAGKTAELLHIVDNRFAYLAVWGCVYCILIAVKLSHQHLVGSQSVGIGAMGVFQLLVAIEAIGGFEGTLLHFMENILHINQAPTLKVEGIARPQKFLHQHRHIELVGIVACQVGITNKFSNFGSELLKRRFIGHIGIVNAMDCCSELWNMDCSPLGVHRPYAVHSRIGGLVRADLVKTYFDNMVVTYVDASGLEVEKYNGFLEIKIHSDLELEGFIS